MANPSLDGRTPERRRADLHRILNHPEAERYGRPDPAVAWITGGLITLIIVTVSVAALGGMRDDVRAVRSSLEALPPCRP